SAVITRNAKDLDFALLALAGLSDSGNKLLVPNENNIIHLLNVLEPTTRLLMKYNPELTCTFLGAKLLMDRGYADAFTFNGRSFLADARLLFGDHAYSHPDNLPGMKLWRRPGAGPRSGHLPAV